MVLRCAHLMIALKSSKAPCWRILETESLRRTSIEYGVDDVSFDTTTNRRDDTDYGILSLTVEPVSMILHVLLQWEVMILTTNKYIYNSRNISDAVAVAVFFVQPS